jgi:hypothetical protein
MPAHVHELVAATAKDMAHELYDTLMQDNVWYDAWKKQNFGASVSALESRFVNKNWGKLVNQARATLAHMLTCTSDEHLRETIYEALQLDQSLIRGRTRIGTGQDIVGQIQ